jgi:uncharacterized C2H2 Zn-finger protein
MGNFGKIPGIVKVHNRNDHLYSEVFDDQQVTIPARKHIEMDQEKALQLVSRFSPPKLDGAGNHMAEGYKMLEIEYPPDPDEPEVRQTCAKCGKVLRSQEELVGHIMTSHKEDLAESKKQFEKEGKK